jgi:hypothetical protein
MKIKDNLELVEKGLFLLIKNGRAKVKNETQYPEIQISLEAPLHKQWGALCKASVFRGWNTAMMALGHPWPMSKAIRAPLFCNLYR